MVDATRSRDEPVAIYFPDLRETRDARPEDCPTLPFTIPNWIPRRPNAAANPEQQTLI